MKRTVAIWQHAFLLGFLVLTSIPVYGTAPTFFTWDGGATTTNWGDANNWNPNVAPTSSANNIVVMSGTAQLTNSVNGNQSIHSLVYSNTAGAFVIGGAGVLTINNAAGILQNSPNAQLLTNSITAAGDQTWTANSNTLTITTGILDLGAAHLTVTGPSNTTITSRIIATGGGGADIIKSGTGSLILSTSNDYGAGTTINNGMIVIAGNVALGARGGTTITGPGTLAFSNNVIYTSAEPLTLNSNGFNNVGSIYNMQGDNAFWGTITLATDSLISAGQSNLTLGGTIDAGGKLLTVSNAATAGIIITNVISSASGKITLSGGRLTLAASNTFTGALTNLTGLLIVTTNHALGTVAGGTVIASGATLAFSNSVNYAAAEAITVSGTGLNEAGSIENLIGTNRFAGPVTLAAASRFRADVDQLTFLGAITNGGFTLNVSNAVNAAMIFSNRVSGTGGLVVQGGGTVQLMATNSFSGSILVTNSILELQSHVAVVTNNVTLAGATLTVKDGSTNVFGALTLASNSTINLNLGANKSSLTFTNETLNGDYLLTINNWTGSALTAGTDDRIFFSTNPGNDFLRRVNFTGLSYGAYWLSTGELVPAPEPGTIISGLLLSLVLGLEGLRRFKSSKRSS
jgi:fibronectin-binding autotransporter adhesin